MRTFMCASDSFRTVNRCRFGYLTRAKTKSHRVRSPSVVSRCRGRHGGCTADSQNSLARTLSMGDMALRQLFFNASKNRSVPSMNELILENRFRICS